MKAFKIRILEFSKVEPKIKIFSKKIRFNKLKVEIRFSIKRNQPTKYFSEKKNYVRFDLRIAGYVGTSWQPLKNTKKTIFPLLIKTSFFFNKFFLSK